MKDQNILNLQEKLMVKADEAELFYFYYCYLRLLFNDDLALNEYVLANARVERKDVIYSYYLDILRWALRPKFPVINLNCCTKFAFLESKIESKFSKTLKFIFMRKVNFTRYFKGLAERKGLFAVVLHKNYADVFSLWSEIKKDIKTTQGLKAFVKSAHALFDAVGLRELYVTDYSDSIYACLASIAKRDGIDVTTIPHGYIQNFSELYTYGLVSTKYICWSESEASKISAMLKHVKPFYFGCPIYSKDYVAGFNKRWLVRKAGRVDTKVVFFSNPLSDKEDKEKDIILFLYSFFKSRGIVFQLKLHPWDVDNEKISRFFLENHVEMIDGVVADIIESVDLVLGFQSTVLYEAAVLGVRAVQVTTSKEEVFRFDYVPQILFDEASMPLVLLDMMRCNENNKINLGFNQEMLMIAV
ncbi:hypothetical protein [Stutzerimonas stutzeri]|uniref:hypothetical protein n=1 Tax=Stutzerimonas stutzeri TaxID=316 RepID=UPI00210A1141|nr:hypothetical protein [Stutzerimonas stutzeri]MCQ4240363.1 hypothetical protein [Stutzerimonas stutzeri]